MKDWISIRSAQELLQLEDTEDLALHICGKVELQNSWNAESCTIHIDTNAGGSLHLSDGRFDFADCEFLFQADAAEPAMYLNDCDLVAEDCVFHADGENGEEPAHNPLYIFAEGGKTKKRSLDFDHCRFGPMTATVLFSRGVSVHFDECTAEKLRGKLAAVYCGEWQEGSSAYIPDFSMRRCTVRDCAATETELTQKAQALIDESGTDYSFLSVHKEIKNALIMLNSPLSAEFRDSNFRDSQMTLVGVNADSRIVVENCSFENCIRDTDLWDDEKWSGDFLDQSNRKQIHDLKRSPQLYLWCPTDLIGCKFVRCSSVFIFSQCRNMLVRDCIFDRCEDTDGVLLLFNDVDREQMFVRNCTFRACNSRNFLQSDGIIKLEAGAVETKQKETCLIENCVFEGCRASNYIQGDEKTDGFFSVTVRMFKERNCKYLDEVRPISTEQLEQEEKAKRPKRVFGKLEKDSERVKKLRALTKAYESELSGTFRFVSYSNISLSKLDNAIAKYADGISYSDVIAMIDASIFHNGKAGYVFTDTCFYFGDLDVKQKIVSFHNLDHVEFVDQGKSDDSYQACRFCYADNRELLWTNCYIKKTPFVKFMNELIDILYPQE